MEQPDSKASTPELLRFFEGSSDSIVTEILSRTDAAWNAPNAVDAFGNKERIRDDLKQHLSVYHNALHAGFPALFGQHMAWLRSVVDARGQDTAHTLWMLETLRQQLRMVKNRRDRALAERTLAEGEQAFGQRDRPECDARGQRDTAAPDHSFTQCLIRGDLRLATEIVTDALRGGATLTGVGVGLVQPSMYEIGELWQHNKVTVAQEHLATTICHNVLATAYEHSAFKEPRGLRAVFAALDGNRHVLGLRMASDAFESEGWTVDYLGADTPLTDLMQMIGSTRPDLIGLSVSLNSQIRQLDDAVKSLKAEFAGRCPPVAIGGLPFVVNPGLVSPINADVWFRDAEAAKDHAR